MTSSLRRDILDLQREMQALRALIDAKAIYAAIRIVPVCATSEEWERKYAYLKEHHRKRISGFGAATGTVDQERISCHTARNDDANGAKTTALQLSTGAERQPHHLVRS